MSGTGPQADESSGKAQNKAFVLRFTWDDDVQQWRVHLKPTDGSKERIFKDLETAFHHITQCYTP